LFTFWERREKNHTYLVRGSNFDPKVISPTIEKLTTKQGNNHIHITRTTSIVAVGGTSKVVGEQTMSRRAKRSGENLLSRARSTTSSLCFADASLTNLSIDVFSPAATHESLRTGYFNC